MATLTPALKIVEETASRWGLAVEDAVLQQLALYLDKLLLWNRRTALVSQNDPLVIACKHFADSIPIAALCKEGERIADLGSGAGFPGLVIAIARPATEVCLIDSKGKKISFLTDVIASASLQNAHAVQGRIETLATDRAHLGKYTTVTSRAFSAIQPFLSQACPFLCKQGRAIAMKGPRYREELAELNLSETGFALTGTKEYKLPDDSQRVLLEFARVP